ncbi:MAG: hypothetical protein FWD17_05245 [Polyangiaceae bacterium]|nr:hypothetical protein [Polyangiaceae bacterium]
MAPHLAVAGNQKPFVPPSPAELGEARRLMADGNYAQACPKLANSESQSPSANTALTLATCYEKAGKIASAWAAYNEAAEVASSSRKKGAEVTAKRGAARLEGQVSRLTIRLAQGRTGGIEVRRDGERVPDSQIGSPVPLDGGGHDVEVAASGKKPWKAHIELASSGQNATVDVPALDDDAPAAAHPSAPAAATAEEPPSSSSPGQAQRMSGLVVGALGVAGLVLGGVAGLEANAKYHDALSACGGGTRCPPGSDGPALRSSAGTWATISTASFIGGGVLLAGGAVLWLTAPNGHAAAATMGLAPADQGTGLSLVGRF